MLASVLAGLSILVVGDSHLSEQGYLIDTLQDQLVAAGAEVYTKGVCGSTPADWTKVVQGTCGGAERSGKSATVVQASAQTASITDLIADHKANLVVVVEGDTIGDYSNDVFPKAWAWQQTTALTKAIAATNTACVWVGPPWGSVGSQYHKTAGRVEQLSGFLAVNVAPCEYIDSTKFSKPGEWGTTDGQHLTLTAYKYWGKDIATQLEQLPGVKSLEH